MQENEEKNAHSLLCARTHNIGVPSQLPDFYVFEAFFLRYGGRPQARRRFVELVTADGQPRDGVSLSSVRRIEGHETAFRQ